MTRKLEDYVPPVKEDGVVTDKNIVTAGSVTSVGSNTTGTTTVKSSTAVPATAGAVAAGAPLTFFNNGPSIYVTSDVPSFTAVKGSICINTAGSSSSTRLY